MEDAPTDDGMVLSHCVVCDGQDFYDDDTETYDADGPQAVERWNKKHKDVDWQEVSDSNFDEVVENHYGKCSQIDIDKIKPFVKVITT